jgi:hypothetical protein
MFNVTSQPFYTRESPHYALSRRLGDPIFSLNLVAKRKFYHCQEMNPSHLACSLISAMAELPK